MGYRDATHGYTGAPLKIGAVIAAVLLAYVARPVVSGWMSGAAATTAAGADAALRGDPAMGATFRLLEQRFPDDYAAIRRAVQDNAGATSQRAMGEAAGRGINTILKRDMRHLAQAPDAALAGMRRAERAVAERLSFTTPVHCAALAEGRPLGTAVSPELTRLLGGMALARLTAIADGRDRPAGRTTGPVPPETTAAYVAALRARALSAPALELVLGERRLDQTQPRQQCEALMAVADALDSMAPGQASRMQTAMMQPPS